MRTGRHLRWPAASALALAVLLAAVVAPAQAAEVRVQGANGHTEVVQLDSLLANPDVRDRPYTVRGADGSTTKQTVTGVSLRAVLRQAGAEVDQFRHAEIQAGSATLTLSREQALEEDVWSGTDGPPVFTVAPDGNVSLLRPSTGPGDANGDDALLAPGGMTIMLRTKIEPRIAVQASTTSPDVGEEVTFTTTVTGVGVGEDVTVTWLFRPKDGGAVKTAEGADVDHTFRAKGTYAVVATMAVAGSSVNASAIVTIKVGGPAEKQTEEEPEDEAGTVTAGGTGGTGTGSGTGTSGTGSADGVGSAGATTPPAAAAPEAEKPAPKRKREKERKPKQPAAPEDTTIPGEVRGELLVADMTPVAAPARQSVAPELPESGKTGALGLPPAAWTGIGIGVALAAGFALDRRRLGRPA